MKKEHPLYEFAQSLLARAMSAWDTILPHYGESVHKSFLEERDEVLARASQLDDALEALLERCKVSRDVKNIVFEMQRLRIRGLQFLLCLHSSRRKLKVITRHLLAKAKIEGYEVVEILLSNQVDMCETDLLLFETDELFRTNPQLRTQPHTPLNHSNEVDLAIKTLVMPFALWRAEVASRRAPHLYAKAIKRLIARSTRNIYSAQAMGLLTVLWRVVQPAVLPVSVALVAFFAGHAILELAGIQFVHLTGIAFVAGVAAFAAEKVLEHTFEEWHLRQYRKQCARTGFRLFTAEIRARVALLGFALIAKAEPTTGDSQKLNTSSSATME